MSFERHVTRQVQQYQYLSEICRAYIKVSCSELTMGCSAYQMAQAKSLRSRLGLASWEYMLSETSKQHQRSSVYRAGMEKV